MKRFRFATCLMVIYAVFLMTACPARTIQKAKDSSAKLATYANSAVNVTRDLYNENVINTATKDRIANAFIVLADAGIAFDLAVKNAETAYGSNPPKSEIDALFATFNTEVVTKFLAVLESLKLVNDTSAYLAVIESLKAAILVIAAAFGKKAQVEAQLI